MLHTEAIPGIQARQERLTRVNCCLLYDKTLHDETHYRIELAEDRSASAQPHPAIEIDSLNFEEGSSLVDLDGRLTGIAARLVLLKQSHYEL